MPDVSSPQFWNEFYLQGQTGWDLGGPTPVFRRLLHSGAYPPGRMIVLGAGRGHDARLFGRGGFDVTAVDFSAEAVAAMQSLAQPDAPVTLLQTDLFDLPAELDASFDYALEYTCFCAIDPRRREAYAERVARLLRTGGRLIALLFPVSGHSGGPPFSVSPEAYVRSMEMQGFTLVHREAPPDSIPQRRGVEELVVLVRR